MWSPYGLTFALTREQKGREAPLLRVGVERVVGRLFHIGTCFVGKPCI